MSMIDRAQAGIDGSPAPAGRWSTQAAVRRLGPPGVRAIAVRRRRAVAVCGVKPCSLAEPEPEPEANVRWHLDDGTERPLLMLTPAFCLHRSASINRARVRAN